jgi:predicted molibdopterin-dependent oxidoreductase YjgC
MFRRLPDRADEAVVFTFDGRSVTARPGDTVAVALLAAGITACRHTPVSGAPRGPFCMMGVCFECLVTVDGRSSRQACMTEVTAGMLVETQDGPASSAPRNVP